jgi:tetratricopeptide (TPR) repeat protein
MPPPVKPQSGGEELEMLFGADGNPPPPKSPPAPAGADGDAYRVRRRSGKIFGPFRSEQVVEMLRKGELLGNEDVSRGGADFTALGAVPEFAEALRLAAADPTGTINLPGAPRPAAGRATSFGGDRMAPPKLVDAPKAPAWDRVPPRVRKAILPAAAVVLLLGLGVGAGFTRFGFFFTRAFRRSDPAKVAQLAGQARAALAKGDYPSELVALDLAGKAVAASPDLPEALGIRALTVAALAQRHGAAPEALAQVRRDLITLEGDARGSVAALVARLVVALADGRDTAADEAALETALAKSPDREALGLLGHAALARRDGGTALARFGKLAAAERGPRGPYGKGLAARLLGKPADAKAAFDEALARDAGHLPSQIELAALAEAAGDLEGATARLVPVLSDAAKPRLGPLDRARALLVQGAILGRRRATAAAADAAIASAIAADGQLVAARVALAAHRLRIGDPARAVEATEPVAARAAGEPELAAVRIRALALAGRALDATQLAEQANGASRPDPALQVARAIALTVVGNEAEAEKAYRTALELDPSAVEPRVALAHLALGRGELAGAAELLGQAVEKGPRDPSALSGQGDLETARGDAAAAEAAYRRALEADPEFAPAEIGLARLALARGELPAARDGLARALALQPRNLDGQLALGELRWKERDLPGAESSFQAAANIQPKHPLALSRLGAVKLERGDADAAVRLLTAASNEADRLAEARLWLGRALLAKGEVSGALAQIKKAVELEPKNFEFHLQLGAVQERAGAITEALDAYKSAAADEPKRIEPHERTGALLASMNRCAEANVAYRKAIELDPKVSRLKLALGECQARLGKHEDAVRTFREVMRADPSAVQVYYLLARSIHEGEGAAAALPWYERAAREDKTNAMPHYYLGYAYKERGQRRRAVEEFKAFLALRPDALEKADILAEIEDLGGAP